MSSLTLTLPLPPNFSNARGHSRWHGTLKKRWIEGTKKSLGVGQEAHLQAFRQVGYNLPLRGKQRCRATFYVWARHDLSNLCARLKWVEDALVRGGVIVNDDPDHWELAEIPKQVVDRKSPRVVLEIEAA